MCLLYLLFHDLCILVPLHDRPLKLSLHHDECLLAPELIDKVCSIYEHFPNCTDSLFALRLRLALSPHEHTRESLLICDVIYVLLHVQRYHVHQLCKLKLRSGRIKVRISLYSMGLNRCNVHWVNLHKKDSLLMMWLQALGYLWTSESTFRCTKCLSSAFSELLGCFRIICSRLEVPGIERVTNWHPF